MRARHAQQATSSTLPVDDSVEALAPDIRRGIAGHWAQRARSELGVAIAFEALLPRLRAASAADVVLALGEKAVEDERRHAKLCVDLATRYLGDLGEVTMPEVDAVALPAFGSGDECVEVALLVLGMCCINESIASSWIHACQQTATATIAVFANRVHLRDEIDHARLGWAHMASSAVSPALRRAIRPWVSRALAANVAEWKKTDRFLPPEGVPAHGHLSAEAHAAVVDAAVADVVLPGLAHVGLVG